jgi:glutaminyl-peptide cyclotransferase
MINLTGIKGIIMTRIFIFKIFALIVLISGCSDNKKSGKPSHLNSAGQIEAINYSVIKTWPHDRGSYTEGFLFHDNQLFESTGSPENYPDTRSLFGIVDLKTGKIEVKAELDRNKYFGEGIVFFGDKLIQLTYQTQTGFIYDAKTFKQTGTFTYANKEGWGLTTDGKFIIMSDGTSTITYLDPGSLKPIKKFEVTFNGSPALYINELEFINGYIYANIWTTSNIAKIDPGNGKVTGIIDLSKLLSEAKKENPESEATNGIAYDRTTDRIFVTGKFWPYIYQIKFPHSQ